MKPERTELYPDIYLNRLTVDKFKTEQLTLYLAVPLKSMAEASHYALLPHVLRRGSTKYPTNTAISRRLEELYSADLSTGGFKLGDRQILTFSIGVLREDFVPDRASLLSDATALLLDILFSPYIDGTTGVFPDDAVEQEKKNACDRIRSLMNNKALYARSRCLTHMCADEVYGIPEWGSEEETARITPASLYAAYRKLLAEAHLEVYYTGTADAAPIVAALDKALSTVRRYPCALPATEIRYRAAKRRSITERSVATQGKLCIGFRSGVTLTDRDAAAFTLFHCIYGASPTSKLFANVREKLSLCYSCASRAELSKGIFLVSAGIENKNRRRAVSEILRQLRRTRAGKITEAEMTMAKKTISTNCRSIGDEVAALERWYLSRALLGIEQSPDEVAAQMSELGIRDVVRVAKKVSVDTIYFLHGMQESGEEEYDD